MDMLAALKVYIDRQYPSPVVTGYVLHVNDMTATVRIDGSADARSCPRLRGAQIAAGDTAVLLRVPRGFLVIGSYPMAASGG